jgi:pimeloyl-ACP methyl ester carboxylesterase
MSTYVLVPGGGGEAWYWAPVVPLLQAAGHEAIAVDLPAGDEDATLDVYADVIASAVAGREDVRVVAHSMGAFSAPLVAERVAVSELALVAPMIPAAGESVDAWWSIHAEGLRAAPPFDEVASFFHDVPAPLVDEALARGEGVRGEHASGQPWPLDAWPDVPTRVLVARHDRLFPYAFARELCRERLGVEADTIDTGHLPALAAPRELVDWLLASA